MFRGATKVADTTLAWGADPSAIYFVLTSQEVTATSGFCDAYCGWHSYLKYDTATIKYAYAGNAVDLCPYSCIAAQNVDQSPNGSPGVDGMVSVIAHEIAETVSDPELDAWYASDWNECADVCAWQFGATTALASGALYNVAFGSRQWLCCRRISSSSPTAARSASWLPDRAGAGAARWRPGAHPGREGAVGRRGRGRPFACFVADHAPMLRAFKRAGIAWRLINGFFFGRGADAEFGSMPDTVNRTPSTLPSAAHAPARSRPERGVRLGLAVPPQPSACSPTAARAGPTSESCRRRTASR